MSMKITYRVALYQSNLANVCLGHFVSSMKWLVWDLLYLTVLRKSIAIIFFAEKFVSNFSTAKVLIFFGQKVIVNVLLTYSVFNFGQWGPAE